ncbi:cell wall assembly protein [Vibrio navarrensis]|nr:cell wall assembly protein [Vibrio navarrensis]
MNREFLSNVEEYNTEYCSIKINTHFENIVLPFGSIEEIESGLKLRQEWDVSDNLIPFQGDWHELLCLDTDSGKVVYINDDREVICSWASTEEFIASLSKEEIAYNTESKLVSSWLSDDLLIKINEFKKKQ